MKLGTVQTIAAAVGISMGHFVYQAIYRHDWSIATERTLFTVMTIAALWLFIRDEFKDRT